MYEQATLKAIETLQVNLNAPKFSSQTEIDENDYSAAHLLRENEGWVAPDKDIVAAYFKHFQGCFAEHNSDSKLAVLLGLSSSRRIREFKSGSRKVSYGIWRKFLVITGRVPQDVLSVMGYLG